MQRLVKEKLLMVIFEVKINLFHRKRRKEIEIDGWRLARRSGKVVKIVCGIIADRLAKGGAPKKKKNEEKKENKPWRWRRRKTRKLLDPQSELCKN